MSIYYVDAGYVDTEYDYDGYLWAKGYQHAEYVEAETRGKARAKFIREQNLIGYDLQWTDKISIRKVDAIPDPATTERK